MPLIVLDMPVANTVYPASLSSLTVAVVAMQAHRNNTGAVYFSDGDAPSAATASGLEFVAPAATVQMPTLTLGGPGNAVQLSALKFVSGSASQKMVILYKQL